MRDYRERTYRKSVTGKEDVVLASLERCLKNLLSYENELLTGLYVERISERAYAQATGWTRYRIRKERTRLLKKVAGALTECISIDL